MILILTNYLETLYSLILATVLIKILSEISQAMWMINYQKIEDDNIEQVITILETCNESKQFDVREMI